MHLYLLMDLIERIADLLARIERDLRITHGTEGAVAFMAGGALLMERTGLTGWLRYDPVYCPICCHVHDYGTPHQR